MSAGVDLMFVEGAHLSCFLSASALIATSSFDNWQLSLSAAIAAEDCELFASKTAALMLLAW